ncbi:hypothetical protein BU15DRAFT_89498 [Melanogaster broomeanus]|nr:hypothetical protein BU15DRAFT_89498 [Melanogaster broomeanus]
MVEAAETSLLRITPITAEQTTELRHLDKHGYHFGAFVPSQDQPVAVISVFFEPIPLPSAGTNKDGNEGSHLGISARFRKFACHPEMDAKILWCDARLSSSQWYRKRGLIPFGDTFLKESVEYTRMKMD